MGVVVLRLRVELEVGDVKISVKGRGVPMKSAIWASLCLQAMSCSRRSLLKFSFCRNTPPLFKAWVALKEHRHSPDLPGLPPLCCPPKWLIELGYSSDTRYMDKVVQKTEQHAILCKLVAAEGNDELLILPVVLGNAGALSKYPDRATKETNIPKAREKKLYSKLHQDNIHSLENLVSHHDTWKDKSQLQKQEEE
jgi:hypothetical protein